MKFMGLDLSLTGAGIVLLDEDGSVLRTVKDGWDLVRGADVIDSLDRMLHIASTILAIVREHGGAEGVRVGIEGYAYNQPWSMAALGELGGVVKSQLWLGAHVAPRVLAVSTARALVFANGRLKKPLVRPMLVERGFAFEDPDIADAYVIAEAVRRQARKENDHGDDAAGGAGDGGGRRVRKRRVGGARKKRGSGRG